MTNRWARLLVLCFLYLGNVVTGNSQSLQMGVSVDSVPVGSDFDGRDIVIFGSIEGAEQAPLYRGEYDVVIEVSGEVEDVIVRQKERVAGIWVNAKSKQYIDVPSFYSVLSRNPLDRISNAWTLKDLRLGVDYIEAKYTEGGSPEFVLSAGAFDNALRRIRMQTGLYSENPSNLSQLSPSLYRANLSLPPNVPIGEYAVKAYLFRDGQKLAEIKSGFAVEKVGFERWIYEFAHEYSLLYGLMAVFVAIFTGWFANLVFRKN